MANKKLTGWGCTKFDYSKKDVLEIVELLRLNSWDESKVFGMMWENFSFSDRPREDAYPVLRLIHSVNSFIVCYSANGEEVWRRMGEAIPPMNRCKNWKKFFRKK